MKILRSLSFGNPSLSSRSAATSLTFATDRRAFKSRSCISILLSLHPKRNSFHNQKVSENMLAVDLTMREDPPVAVVHNGDGVNLRRAGFTRVDYLANGLQLREPGRMAAKLYRDLAEDVLGQVVTENEIVAVAERVQNRAVFFFCLGINQRTHAVADTAASEELHQPFSRLRGKRQLDSLAALSLASELRFAHSYKGNRPWSACRYAQQQECDSQQCRLSIVVSHTIPQSARHSIINLGGEPSPARIDDGLLSLA